METNSSSPGRPREVEGGGGGLGLNTRGVRIIHAPGHVQVLSTCTKTEWICRQEKDLSGIES